MVNDCIAPFSKGAMAQSLWLFPLCMLPSSCAKLVLWLHVLQGWLVRWFGLQRRLTMAREGQKGPFESVPVWNCSCVGKKKNTGIMSTSLQNLETSTFCSVFSSWFLLCWRHPGFESNTIKSSALSPSSFCGPARRISCDRRQRRRPTSFVPLSAHAAGDGLIGLWNQTAAGTTVERAAWARGGKCLSHRVSHGALDNIPKNSQSEQQIFSLIFIANHQLQEMSHQHRCNDPLTPKGPRRASLLQKNAL